MEQLNIHTINRLYNFDLDIFESGYHKRLSNSSYGPAAKGYYLIHYVINGCGSLYLNNKVYEVHAGEAFLLFPNDVATYTADELHPWEYTWIGFNGIKADSFFNTLNLNRSSHRVLTFDEEPLCFKELRNTTDVYLHDEIKLLGLLYLMFYDLLKQNTYRSINTSDHPTHQITYSNQIMEFINNNFNKKISIDDMANDIGLNKSYLGYLFKSTFNISIKAYLLDLRIKKACELLKETNSSIYEVSNAVGYEDALQFSKIFKKHTHVSPTEYRKNHSTKHE